LAIATALTIGLGVARADEYNLVIDDARVQVGGRATDGMNVNGQIPGPLLRFREGEEVVIHVRNASDQRTQENHRPHPRARRGS
jgi:L-ascorbate oxidase